MSNLYSVATRNYGPREHRYVVLRGPVIPDDQIDPSQVVQEFEARADAGALADKLNLEGK